jgi:hypothetical protein
MKRVGAVRRRSTCVPATVVDKPHCPCYHLPQSGKLRATGYIPGRLSPV